MKDLIATMAGQKLSLREIMQQAAGQFRSYVKSHNDKATEEGFRKARVNAACADIIETAIPRLDEMEEELAYWRQEAVARAWAAACSINAAMDEGGHTYAAGHYHQHLAPALAAIKAAKEKDFHTRCLACGQALKHGQWAVIWEDGERSHLDCDNPNAAPTKEMADIPNATEIYDNGFGAEDVAKMMALALGAAERVGNI